MPKILLHLTGISLLVLSGCAAPAPAQEMGSLHSAAASPASSPKPDMRLQADLFLKRHLYAVINVEPRTTTNSFECNRRAPVLVQRRVAQQWRTITRASRIEGYPGLYEERIPDRVGAYRVKIVTTQVANRTCIGSVSKVVNHSH